MNAIFETLTSRLEKVSETNGHYRTEKITGSQKAIDVVKEYLGVYFDNRMGQEHFMILTMDTKNQVTGMHKITTGTLDATLIHPREVFKPAILSSASSIILVHNHPSGDSTPSREDYAVTDRLEEAGKLLGIDVLDHIVYGSQTDCTSIKESR